MKRLFCWFLLLFLVAAPSGLRAESPPQMTVWKTPWCGCCGDWVTHMRDNGFDVAVREIEDLDGFKQMAGIPESLQSCHTAQVDGYVIEGHVPAADVKRLLSSRPAAHGLFVPGMPSGSPVMENGMRDPYDVLLLKRDGRLERFNSYE